MFQAAKENSYLSTGRSIAGIRNEGHTSALVTEAGVLVLAVAALGVLAGLPLWLLVQDVRRGAWSGRDVDVVRNERPFAFWFGIVVYGLLGAIILAVPVYIVWDALRHP
jgi:hypothetical protein